MLKQTNLILPRNVSFPAMTYIIIIVSGVSKKLSKLNTGKPVTSRILKELHFEIAIILSLSLLDGEPLKIGRATKKQRPGTGAIRTLIRNNANVTHVYNKDRNPNLKITAQYL